MKPELTRLIAEHIFNNFGFLLTTSLPMMVCNVKSKEFLLPQKISFDTEDRSFSHSVWGSQTQLNTIPITLLIADVSMEFDEYILIFQFGTNSPCALRLSKEPEDTGTSLIKIDPSPRWVDGGSLFRAKLMVAIESLKETILNWQPLTKYQDIYQLLLSFLKFDDELHSQ